jgi:hypothetical protein
MPETTPVIVNRFNGLPQEEFNKRWNVAEVKSTEWTKAGEMRHPAYNFACIPSNTSHNR